MALFWITGLPGAGKTTLLKELDRLGFQVHDGDHLSRWFERSTGLPVDDVRPVDRPHDWIHRMDWRIDVERIRLLSDEAADRLIFVGGSVSNESEIWELFDGHLFLTLDSGTLQKRVTERTNNDYGKGPGELEAILQWNATAEDKYRSFGATIIDASRPVAEVAQAVVTATAGQRDIARGLN